MSFKINKFIRVSKLNIEKVVFYSFLGLLVWMPLPVGSNRVLFLSLAEMWLFLLAIILLVIHKKGMLVIPDVLNKSRSIHGLFIIYLLFLLLHLIPLPVFLVELISPARLESVRLIFPDNNWLSLSENFHESLSFFIESIFYYLIFIFTLLLVNNRQRINFLMWVIVYSALFQAMYGSLMILSGIEYGFFFEKYAYRGVATGTFINRNHLAGYLNMSIAIGLGILISGLGKKEVLRTTRQWSRKIVRLLLSKKAQLRVYIALCTIALVLTHSRMGNTAFFISLTLTALLTLKLTRHARKMMAVLVVSIIVIDVLIVSAWFGLDKVADRIEKTSADSETRDEVVRDTVNYWQDYFITGSGGGTYKDIFPKYRGYDVPLYYDHAHNDILEFAAETGTIGIVLLMSIVLLSLFTAIKAMSLRRESLVIGLAFSSIMGILAITIHSFVDFNLQIPANAATFMVILALAWIARFQSFEE